MSPLSSPAYGKQEGYRKSIEKSKAQESQNVKTERNLRDNSVLLMRSLKVNNYI